VHSPLLFPPCSTLRCVFYLLQQHPEQEENVMCVVCFDLIKRTERRPSSDVTRSKK
jgi:hypothetical protein